MSKAKNDAPRALAAAKEIVDRRDATKHESEIMVTLEHTIATVLLLLYPDPRTSAAMLNEGLVPGVEARLAIYGVAMRQINK